MSHILARIVDLNLPMKNCIGKEILDFNVLDKNWFEKILDIVLALGTNMIETGTYIGTGNFS